MTADEALETLDNIEQARDKLSDRPLDHADAPRLEGLLRLQNTAALTLIALELRALRQSFERGECPVETRLNTAPTTIFRPL